METNRQIEAILFWKGEGVTLPELCRALKLPSNEVKRGLATLQEKLAGRGVALIQNDDEFSLATVPEASEFIENLRKEELSRELGKAALETLSIVLYKGMASRRDIEYIRGVNSTAILRSLLIRGLVERRQSEKDERVFLYHPTTDLLALLSLQSVSDLPEYTDVQAELDAAEKVVISKELPRAPEDALTDDSEPFNAQ